MNEDHQLAYEVKNNIEFNKKILKTISEKNYHLKFKITFKGSIKIVPSLN